MPTSVCLCTIATSSGTPNSTQPRFWTLKCYYSAILFSSTLSFPPTQTSPRITCRWLLSPIASSRVVSIPTRTTGIVCRLHRTVVLRWRTRRWRRGMPAWWELLLLLLLLAISVLCSSGLAVVLLSWRRREVLLVRRRGDGAVGRGVVG